MTSNKIRGCEIKGCANAGLIRLWFGWICTMHNVGMDEFLRQENEQAVREARIEENRYYAKLLKLNEKSTVDNILDGITPIKVNLRKVFEYRLKQLTSKDKNTKENTKNDR